MISPHVCKLVPHLVCKCISAKWFFIFFFTAAYRHDQTPNTIKAIFILFIANTWAKKKPDWKWQNSAMWERERVSGGKLWMAYAPLTITSQTHSCTLCLCTYSQDKEINIAIYPSTSSISLTFTFMSYMHVSLFLFHSSLFFHVAALKYFISHTILCCV